MTKKVMISLDAEVHERAVKRSRERHFSSFSGYLTQLIADDLGATRIPAVPLATAIEITKALRQLSPHDAQNTPAVRSRSKSKH